MAWGYEKSFVTEHVDAVGEKTEFPGRECYDNSDRSCMKRPFYMPEDRYN